VDRAFVLVFVVVVVVNMAANRRKLLLLAAVVFAFAFSPSVAQISISNAIVVLDGLDCCWYMHFSLLLLLL